MYDRILVPTDGSDWAMAAANHAFALAKLGDATVHALSVVDLRHFEDDVVGSASEDLSIAEQAAKAAVERVQQVGEESGCRVRTHVERGIPHETVLRFVADHDVDLVVMGTHGRTGLERFLLGSVTERVLRGSPVPVLTTHLDGDGGTLPTYEHLLVPTDGSEGARDALDRAVAVATAAGARLTVLSVVDSRAFTGGFETGPTLPNIREQLQQYAEDAADALVRRAADAGVDADSVVTVGLPATEITAYAESNDVDLVVMGTHGRSGLERLILGSVTERVVRTSETPVLAVTPTE
ncbi:Nucleotide-binding universal stress protein, UspA family [Halogranum gelatinilyticum]|uniref:Nucleotide-binding universal stress protein, UspA family n=1 Tax=Halogranum gelatinilyticum TaxID=660521 RepID=A0A1G9UR07_9EURY|nr:universal stress protein [Halogranum gelatinilyticum]SDM62330.1 Nucleotide-binding universal stress protein, UspA family [Halogranum gelatinilyticum]